MCKTNTYLLIGAGQTLSSGPLVTVEQLERRSSSETIEPLRSYPGPRHPSRTLAPPVSRLRPPVMCPASVLVLTCALVSHLYSNSIKHSTLIYTYIVHIVMLMYLQYSNMYDQSSIYIFIICTLGNVYSIGSKAFIF